MEDFYQFSWKKVVIFNFENCEIGDDGFATLSQKITKYQNIQKIFLGNYFIDQSLQ